MLRLVSEVFTRLIAKSSSIIEQPVNGLKFQIFFKNKTTHSFYT